jgi:hypothetical protein
MVVERTENSGALQFVKFRQFLVGARWFRIGTATFSRASGPTR